MERNIRVVTMLDLEMRIRRFQLLIGEVCTLGVLELNGEALVAIYMGKAELEFLTWSREELAS